MVEKKITLSSGNPTDTSVNLLWVFSGFSSNSDVEIEIYQNGKIIKSFYNTKTKSLIAKNLTYSTSYNFYVVVKESGKTYTSNIVTVRTLSDPYSYDRNEIGINLSELEKNSAILVSSIENTVELSKNSKFLIVDFYSGESINSKGREVANALAASFRNINKCTIVSLPLEDKETMKKSGGIKD